MEDNFDQTELHKIINRALAKCMNHENYAVNSEINIVCARYIERQNKKNASNTSPQLPQSLRDALYFCNDLEEYRIAADVYSDKNRILDENYYRRMLTKLAHYDSMISSENKTMQYLLENNFKRRLPEYKNEILLDEYIKDADRIYRAKKEYDNRNRKKQPASKDYERAALSLFKELFTDKELHEIKAHPKKVTLYEKCLEIVNCLPASHYSRTAKFKLKKDLNYGLLRTASLLGQEYAPKVNKAQLEMDRYQKAIEKTQYFSENPIKKRKLSVEEYNRRKFEEWYYC